MSKSDKNKSSGILDSLFGRPRPKSKVKNYNTGNSLSTEGDLDLKELHSEIRNLEECEVDKKFMEILEDMNIPHDKRKPLFLKPISEKRDLIFMHLKGKSSLDHRSNSRYEKPCDYIEFLQSSDHSEHKIYQCLENLRVALTSNPISWIKDFGEEGIDEIVNMYRKSKKQYYDRIEFECIRCLKAIMNNTWGLNLILTPDQHAVLLLLSQSLDPKKPHIMCEALKLLASFCLVPERNGYEKVLRAITSAAAAKYMAKERFKPIVDGLFQDEKNDSKRDLCCHSLIFINTITNTPSDLNFRLHLRCEIMRMGLYNKLNILDEIVEKSSNENLRKHFKIFNDIREDDFEEFVQKFDNVRFEMDDLTDCFEVLKNLVTDTPSEPFFLSILQHLLYIRDDHLYRPAYYQLIEECISQIVFHKGYCDPDFQNRIFNIDTTLILDEIVEKSKINYNKRIEEYEKKIELLETAKQEAEARSSTLEEKIKLLGEENPANVAFQNTLNTLKNSSVSVGLAPPPPPPPPLPFGSTGTFHLGVPPPPPPPPLPANLNTSISGRAPAPPPPPPMMPAMAGMRPPPPPMFGQLSLTTPVLPPGLKPKKKWQVKNPMKRANWKAVNPSKLSEKSFWVKCQEDILASEDLLGELSSRFSSKMIVKETKDNVDKASHPKKQVIDLRVLDSKTAQNILILLGGSLKHLSYEQIKLCIYRCDTNILTSNVLQQLIQYLPPPEQLKRLQKIRDSGETLSGAEEFAAVIGEIDRLAARLQNINSTLVIPDIIHDIKPDIVAGTAACEEVKKSRKFAKVLELILLFGNYMNSGTKNEQAFGFELSFLTKLTNTKDVENKQTLLHYIADIVEKKFPDILDFPEDLAHVDKASRVSLETIQKNMRQMKTFLRNIETDIKLNKPPQCEDDKYLKILTKFLDECHQQVDVLDKMHSQMEKLYKDLSEYYVFDPDKYSMEDFFSDLKGFKESFVQASQENIRQREEEERMKRIREARERSQRDLLERQQRKLALVDIDSAQTQEGVMDSLLEALQTGSAFVNRDPRNRKRHRAAGAERRAQLNVSRSRKETKNNLNAQREITSFN